MEIQFYQFSFIGYQSQEIKGELPKGEVNVCLQENVQSLDEVMVVAYGVQEKSDIDRCYIKCRHGGFTEIT